MPSEFSERSLSSPLVSTALLRAQLCCLSELPLWRLSERTTFRRVYSTIPSSKPRILLSQGRSQTLLRPPSGAPLLTSALLKAQLEAQLCCLSELPLWCPSERTTFWRVFSTIPLSKPRILLSQGRSHTLSYARPLERLCSPLLRAQLCCLSELPLWHLSERTTF